MLLGTSCPRTSATEKLHRLLIKKRLYNGATPNNDNDAEKAWLITADLICLSAHLVYFDARQNALLIKTVHKTCAITCILAQGLLEKNHPGDAAS